MASMNQSTNTEELKQGQDLWQSCLVCEDKATGRHYGILACEGCKGFFKRSIRKSLIYSCRDGGDCPINRLQRNRCRGCRLKKCLNMGMRREAVQCERKPVFNLAVGENLPSNMHHEKPNNNSSFTSSLCRERDFTFQMNIPVGEVLSMDYVYELATRLLFQSIDWARLTPSFSKLQNNDQVILLKSSWCDLFLLGLVQCARVFPLDSTLAIMIQEVQQKESESQEAVLQYIYKVKDLLYTLERLEMTDTEFALLKCISLFNPDVVGVKDVKLVEELQETAQCELKEFVSMTYPCNKSRFAKILLRLPAIKTVSSKKIEEIFFSPLIGEVKIDHIMPSILNNASDMSETQNFITGS